MIFPFETVNPLRQRNVQKDLSLYNRFSEEFKKLRISEQLLRNRSSHRWRSMKKGALGNFAKFAGKHPYQSLFFNKGAGLRQIFAKFCEFCEIFKNTLFTKHLRVTTSGRGDSLRFSLCKPHHFFFLFLGTF